MDLKPIPYGISILINYSDEQKARIAAGEDWMDVVMGITDEDRRRWLVRDRLWRFLYELKVGTLDAMRQMVRIGDFSVVSHEAIRFLISECDDWWQHRCD